MLWDLNPQICPQKLDPRRALSESSRYSSVRVANPRGVRHLTIYSPDLHRRAPRLEFLSVPIERATLHLRFETGILSLNVRVSHGDVGRVATVSPLHRLTSGSLDFRR
jgi:hypothetical protein